METRANHLLIGTFVLVVTAGAFGFVLWLAKLDIDREFQSYHICFEGSVSGLSLGSDVLYRGIPVGTVTEILIDPEDPGRVLVAVDLASTTPIRQDSIATLEVQGITGVSLIQIGGGGHDSPVLQAEPGAAFPVIRALAPNWSCKSSPLRTRTTVEPSATYAETISAACCQQRQGRTYPRQYGGDE